MIQILKVPGNLYIFMTQNYLIGDEEAKLSDWYTYYRAEGDSIYSLKPA